MAASLGIETSIGERIIEANYSVLSGEIGTIQKTDNTINVLFIAHATKATTIDGFIITGGYAGGDGAYRIKVFFRVQEFIMKEVKIGNKSNPIIKNCRFIENTARDGGAFFNNASQWRYLANPLLINCTFQNNKAFLGGGAIFNNGIVKGNASPVIRENNFIKNTAGFGGAIFNYGQNGRAISLIKNTIFTNNRAMIQGGGIFNLGGNGQSNSQLTNCRFEENFAPKGSTVANSMAKPKSQKEVKKI